MASEHTIADSCLESEILALARAIADRVMIAASSTHWDEDCCLYDDVVNAAANALRATMSEIDAEKAAIDAYRGVSGGVKLSSASPISASTVAHHTTVSETSSSTPASQQVETDDVPPASNFAVRPKGELEKLSFKAGDSRHARLEVQSPQDCGTLGNICNQYPFRYVELEPYTVTYEGETHRIGRIAFYFASKKRCEDMRSTLSISEDGHKYFYHACLTALHLAITQMRGWHAERCELLDPKFGKLEHTTAKPVLTIIRHYVIPGKSTIFDSSLSTKNAKKGKKDGKRTADGGASASAAAPVGRPQICDIVAAAVAASPEPAPKKAASPSDSKSSDKPSSDEPRGFRVTKKQVHSVKTIACVKSRFPIHWKPRGKTSDGRAIYDVGIDYDLARRNGCDTILTRNHAFAFISAVQIWTTEKIEGTYRFFCRITMVKPDSDAPHAGAGAARYDHAREVDDAQAALSTATLCAAKAQSEYNKAKTEDKRLASIAADAALEKAQAALDALLGRKK